MFTIAKAFSFSASHRLEGLPADHPCSRLHGHNYVVELEFGGYLDDVGFIIDYRALDPFKKFIDTKIDHRDLNDVLGNLRGKNFNPTAENLALYFYECAVRLFTPPSEQPFPYVIRAVRVRETDKTVAEYRP